jgi:hypothetical protein
MMPGHKPVIPTDSAVSWRRLKYYSNHRRAASFPLIVNLAASRVPERTNYIEEDGFFSVITGHIL